MSRLMPIWKVSGKKRTLLVWCYDSNVTKLRSLSCWISHNGILSQIEIFFSLLTCTSELDLEAEQSQETLQGLIEELLRSNQQISSRLQNIEDSLETGSIPTNCFRNGTLDESAEDSDPEDLYRVEPDRHIRRNLPEDSSQPGFHDDLGTSRVYRRTERY
jgi:hypothetical protein